ncbi:MAG: phosphatase PAP2 family protein, partial [Chitinophagia bacterium]|nr:phosphatase PAP2 family protein [Chitinophagia bacterium]
MLWIPLYLFIFLFLLINFKKQGVWIIVFLILTVSLTDSISSHVFKPFFNRLRPCSDPEMDGMVRLLLNYAPRNGSFTSSHAANHFGIAFFLYQSLKPYFAHKLWPFFLWAFFISYAQVYVGVHYPMDIIGGPEYLISLLDKTISSANIVSHAKIVREKALLRKMIMTNSKLIERAYDQDFTDVETFIDQAESEIFKLGENKTQSGLIGAMEIVKASIQKIEELYKRKAEVTGVGT